jgi:hypothetical protein
MRLDEEGERPRALLLCARCLRIRGTSPPTRQPLSSFIWPCETSLKGGKVHQSGWQLPPSSQSNSERDLTTEAYAFEWGLRAPPGELPSVTAHGKIEANRRRTKPTLNTKHFLGRIRIFSDLFRLYSESTYFQPYWIHITLSLTA